MRILKQYKRRNLPSYIWLIAFLILPIGPYVALYFSGAISRSHAIFCSLLTQTMLIAFIYCISETEVKRDQQQWVLMSLTLYYALVATYQYSLGQKLHLWPRSGLRVWKKMAILYLIMFILLMTFAVLGLVFPGLKDA